MTAIKGLCNKHRRKNSRRHDSEYKFSTERLSTKIQYRSPLRAHEHPSDESMVLIAVK